MPRPRLPVPANAVIATLPAGDTVLWFGVAGTDIARSGLGCAASPAAA